MIVLITNYPKAPTGFLWEDAFGTNKNVILNT